MQDTRHAAPPRSGQPKHKSRQEPDTAIRLPRGDTTPFWTLPRPSTNSTDQEGSFQLGKKPSFPINKQHRQTSPRPPNKSSRQHLTRLQRRLSTSNRLSTLGCSNTSHQSDGINLDLENHSQDTSKYWPCGTTEILNVLCDPFSAVTRT